MEQQEANAGGRPEQGRGWDAVPRDGPAIFVVDRHAWERRDTDGVWVGTDESGFAIAARLTRQLGKPVAIENLVIVDQIGVGPAQLDEDLLQLDSTAGPESSSLTRDVDERAEG
jgi:hypothetical protein